MTIRVIIVDDQAMVRAGFAALLSAQADTICGADYGSRDPDRTNRRNGHREFARAHVPAYPWPVPSGNGDIPAPLRWVWLHVSWTPLVTRDSSGRSLTSLDESRLGERGRGPEEP